MKSYREKYFENYIAESVPSGNKKGFRIAYRYTGLFIEWYEDGISKGFLKGRYALLETLSIVCFLISAFQQSAFNRIGYTCGFAYISLIFWMLEISGVIRFLLAGKMIKEMSQKEIDVSLSTGGNGRAICLFLALILGAGTLITAGGITGADMMSIAGLTVSAVISCVLAALHRKLLIRTYRNRNGVPDTQI